MGTETTGAGAVRSLQAQVEKLTPFTPFFGRTAARIPPAEATGLRFWLLTFAEHGLFIAGNLPCDRQNLIAQAKSYSDYFYGLLSTLVAVRADANAGVADALQCAQSMLQFVNTLMDMEVAGDLASTLPPSVYLHMDRETRRFILIASQPDRCIEPLGAGVARTPLVNLLDAEHFWLVNASEHSEQIGQAVDPVQLRFMEENHAWEALMRHLGIEAGDLKKMAEAMPPRMPAAALFTRHAVGAIVGDRDFMWDTYELRNANQLLGNQPALLAYHNAREMEHARLVIEALAAVCV